MRSGELGNQAAAGAGIRHVAWLYRGPGEFVAGVREFAATAEPVLVAVPAARLPAGLAGDDATVLDVEELGRNPARIMPSLRAFAQAHPDRGVRVLAELAWPGRSAAELGEVARYESMLEYAFAGHTMTIMCSYNEAELADSVISAARISHPRLLRGGREFDSGDYRSVLDGHGMAPPLLAPATARKLTYQRDLRPVRALVAAAAAEAGLPAGRCTDLLIAVSEVAANTLKHTSGGGTVRVWMTADEVLCQLDDSGHILDPLAGYALPGDDEPGGHGLWLVNQVCDLAEIRSSELGTTVRLHMYRQPPRSGLVTAG